MAAYPTPHINAAPEDFAGTVLMPGDPLRSEFIAKNFLSGARLVNDVRGVHGYTGEWKGKRVSVMASGMGMPSIGIYSWELYNVFGVQNILRVGSAGSMQPDVKIRDIVLASGASTNSAYAAQFRLPGTFAPVADFHTLCTAKEEADKLGAAVHVGNVLSSDVYYSDDPDASSRFAALGVLCVEMESAALYLNAAKARKNALAILTVSDELYSGRATTAEERQTSFTQMMEIALNTAIRL
ncbi:MAG: purine-nucleoside phosphorylase [Clostridia bacterium]|nr:purine-nucleoside phosphorylase [Clostridia bacterium]